MGVDRRVGDNTIRNVGSTWGDVRDIFNDWVTNMIASMERNGMARATD